MTNLVKVRNTTDVIYNGYRPNSIAEVEDPRPLILAGWTLLEAEKEQKVEETYENILKSKKLKELKELAKEKGIDADSMKKKSDVIALLLEAEKEQKVEEKKDDNAEDLDALTDELDNE